MHTVWFYLGYIPSPPLLCCLSSRFSTTQLKTLPQGKAHSSLWRLLIEIKQTRNNEVAAGRQYLWITFSTCSSASACLVDRVIKDHARTLLLGANIDTLSSTHICLRLSTNPLLYQNLIYISIKHLHFQPSDRTKLNFILLYLCNYFCQSYLI